MVMSMTGFASYTLSLTHEQTQTQITITLKSLNSRFLEVTSKVPYSLSSIESDCMKLFKQYLFRGNITCVIQVSNATFFKGAVQPEFPLIKGYVDACQQIQTLYNIPGTVTINDLLALPNLFSAQEQIMSDAMKEQIMDGIAVAVQKLVEVRNQEGAALLADLEERIRKIEGFMSSIEERARFVMEKRTQEITHKITLLNSQPEVSKELTESHRSSLYFELDKIDIHEEITRFKNHLKTFSQELLSPEIEKGRRLDFILQELGREINTITAKCNDTEISSWAIHIKVEQEKAREQVQNIV